MMISQRMIQPVISGQKRPELLVSQAELTPQTADIGVTGFSLGSILLRGQVYFTSAESGMASGFELNAIAVRELQKKYSEEDSTVTGFSLGDMSLRDIYKRTGGSSDMLTGFSLDEILVKDFGLKIQERRDSNVVTRFELNELKLTGE